MHACDMTPTYLRGGLSTCSVVWGSVHYCFLKVTNVLMQLCKTFFQKLEKPGHIPSFSGAAYACATLFGSALLLRLSATSGFSLKMTISNVVSSIFSYLTS